MGGCADGLGEFLCAIANEVVAGDNLELGVGSEQRCQFGLDAAEACSSDAAQSEADWAFLPGGMRMSHGGSAGVVRRRRIDVNRRCPEGNARGCDFGGWDSW